MHVDARIAGRAWSAWSSLLVAAMLAAVPARALDATFDTGATARVSSVARATARVSSVARAPVPKAAVTAVTEFYNAARDHYFMTADAREVADLDAGVHPGWQRTGMAFGAYATQAEATSPVCRFYLPPPFGDSHFFSASADECATTRTRFPGFVLETSSAFDIALPDASSGACPPATVPVYRLWNGRADTNHRYTSERAEWQRMRDRGWIAEGYGAAQVAMCAPPAPVASVDVAVKGRAVVKARVAGDVVALLEERLTSLTEDGPDRILAWLQPDGRSTRAYAPPPGWSLTDFTVHPSGDVSLVLTTARTVRVVRLDRNGVARIDQVFVDAAAAHDPFIAYDTTPKDDDALQPFLMHDAARVVALGEDLALVLRTGRNAVVAYRLAPNAAGGYVTAWRTLVEPGSSLDGVFLTSGSYDTFGQLVDHVAIHVDADGNGTLAIAVVDSPFRSFVFQAHAAYFAQPIAARAGVLVTRVDGATGQRLGSSVIDTQQQSELHGLRATTDGFQLTGRLRTQLPVNGANWDAWIATVASDGSIVRYRPVDVDRGDLLFDAVVLPSGHTLALGTTGYLQNPTGGSISEDSQPLLLVLDRDGALLERLALPDGPRQDQLRTIVTLDARWLVGGMLDGPGTHSGDAQPQLIKADGFLVEMSGLSTH